MRAVIFDMDGVLVDSERQWKLAGEAQLRRLAPRWTEADSEAIVGLGVVELHEYLERRHAPAPPRSEFLALCDGLADEVYGRRVTPAAGLEELLSGLAGRGAKIGLASSSPRPWVDRVLDRFSLRRHFAALASGDETPGRVKPEPDLYLLAAKRLGVEPARCTAVEDSRYGVAAAKAAGMRCLALRGPDNAGQDLSQADAEIPALRGSLDVLLGLPL
jgi:HAD superfamily hydrolase (TIGR01509 family)